MLQFMKTKNAWPLGCIGVLFGLGGLYLHVRTSDNTLYRWSGITMGRIPYSVLYRAAATRPINGDEVDSLLSALNQSLSHYLPTSELSRLNKSDSFRFETPHLQKVLQASQLWYQRSQGYFDPALGTLSAHYGFGPQADTTSVEDKLSLSYGFLSVRLSATGASKPRATQIDLSAIAKGYVVDCVAAMLEERGIVHYMVEIGGELRTQGTRGGGRAWRIGIERPSPTSRRRVVARLRLRKQALATSGNYRARIQKKDGTWYGHTLNPHTAQPASNEWLSVSIVAEDCMTADAVATACMAMGRQASIQWVQSMPDIALLGFYQNASSDTIAYLSEELNPRIDQLLYPLHDPATIR